MALPNFPTLVKRLVKGSQVTHAEGDANLDAIKSYCEMLASLFGVALNADGTLNADAVTTISILNRQVTEAKLGPVSVFPTKQDTGSTNTLKIALVPPLTAYADGQTFLVKVVNTNTGPATINVDNIGAVSIKKRGVVDLESGDYEAGSVIIVTYFGGSFHLVSGSGTSTNSSSSSDGFSGFQTYESVDVAIPPSAPVSATGTLTSSGVNVSNGDTVTIGAKMYTFQTVLTNVDGNVLIGASATASMTNLFNAINDTGGGTPGTDYAAAMTPHPTVTATNPSATTVVVTAVTAGIGGNSIATTEVAATLAWGAITLTGGVTDSFTNFTHGFTAAPTEYKAYLVNTVADLSFLPGDLVGVDEFTDSTGLPAFTVSANSINVKVERHPASIEVGALGAITTSSWQLRVRASVKTNAGTVVFPAVQIMARGPQGVFSNGDDLFIVTSTTYGFTTTTHFNRLKLSTNNITRLVNPATGANPTLCSGAPFTRADSSHHVVFTTSGGVYTLPLLEVASPNWKPVQLTSAVLNYWKPVHIVDAGTITEVYCCPSEFGAPRYINNIALYKITTSSGATTDVGSPVDFTSASILSADGTPGNVEFRALHPNGGVVIPLMIQYNKTKKRIYIITNESCLLHIFEIDDTGFVTPGSILEWWTSGSGRYAKLQYIKTISVAGDGAPSTTYGEQFYIDIDLATGAERALCFYRSGHATVGGSVTRIPWRE